MRRIRIVVCVMVIAGIVGGVLIQPASAANEDFTVFATAQRFEYGMMLYRSDTGFIWVLFDSGQAWGYASSSYGALPDNPFFNVPSGRVRPINGFGRVWGNHQFVRDHLGWATYTEIGLQMRVQAVGDTIYLTYLTQFDRQLIQINPNGTWQYAVTAPPTSVARINAFKADQNIVEPGGTLGLKWDITGTDVALIEMYDAAGALVSFTPDLAPVGSTMVTIPATVGDSVRIVLWGANRPRYYVPATMYERVVQSTLTISVSAPGGGATTYTQAAYQPYERGFMIWREDTGAVMAFWGDASGQWTSYPEPIGLPNNPDQASPGGLVNPVNAFGRIWYNYDNVRNQLGWAIGPEQPYTLTVQTFTGATSLSFRLPDGRTLYTTRAFWSFE